MPKTDEDLAFLRSRASGVVARLHPLTYAPSSDTSHAWHMDWLDRGHLLAGHLDAVLELEASRRYPGALALVRVAVEHFLIDRLIVLGQRWEQHVLVGPDQEPDEVEMRLRDQGADGTLLDVRRVNHDRFIVIRPGLRAGDDPEEWFSAYTFWDEQYDPFRPRPDGQTTFQGYFMDLEDHRRLAQESAVLWHRAFSWRALRRNLRRPEAVVHEALARAGGVRRSLRDRFRPLDPR